MKERFCVKQTRVGITADEKEYIQVAKEEIKRRRKEVERFILRDPYFEVIMKSYDYREKVPETVQRMIIASQIFGIGPMSAVAGAIAELAVEAMVNAGAKHAIVDNGGDIALINDRTVHVGIYAGESPFTNKIALRIKPSSSLFGICTSSGTVGHSISFGNACVATVISDSATLADAAATALGNAVTDAHSVSKAFNLINHVEGIEGALIIYDDMLVTWGKIPQIVRVKT